MIVRNKLLNYTDSYIFQDTDYFKFSLDSVLLANFVTINKRDKMILDIATGNAPIPMLLSFRTNAKIYGVEIQKVIYNLGVISINENNMKDQIKLINILKLMIIDLRIITLLNLWQGMKIHLNWMMFLLLVENY